MNKPPYQGSSINTEQMNIDQPKQHKKVLLETLNRSLSAVTVLGPVQDVLLHDPVRMQEEWDMLRRYMPQVLTLRLEEESRLREHLSREEAQRLDTPRWLGALEEARRLAEARRSGDGWRLGLAVYHNPYARHQIPLLFESLGKATIQNHYRYKYYIPAEYGGGDDFWMAHLSPDPNHSDEDGPLGRPRLRT